MAVIIIIDISGGRTIVEHWLAVVIVYMMSALFNPIVTFIFKDDYNKTLQRNLRVGKVEDSSDPNAWEIEGEMIPFWLPLLVTPLFRK